VVEAEIFLALDPLVGISTAIAAREWVWSLAWAGVILVLSILIPRGFCGYICPLGTLIDLFDWAIGKRVQRFRVERRGGWIHLKYYLLAGTLAAAAGGVLVSGYVAAIPVITRGFAFALAPLQLGWAKGWYQVPPMNTGHIVSILLFIAVLALGLMRPRFWCRYICPTGAVFSLGNLLTRASERKVEDSCIDCGKCVEVCPFEAIKPDFTTRTMDCTLCNNCGQVCPTGAIRALPLAEKRVARMGLAEVKNTCLPLAGKEECQLCVDECTQAGYNAIEFERVHPEIDEQGLPIEGTGFAAPVLIADQCVGCGLCQSICHRINVKDKGLLQESAIIVYAGPGKEDRILEGTYTKLRRQEQQQRQHDRRQKLKELGDFY